MSHSVKSQVTYLNLTKVSFNFSKKCLKVVLKKNTQSILIWSMALGNRKEEQWRGQVTEKGN